MISEFCPTIFIIDNFISCKDVLRLICLKDIGKIDERHGKHMKTTSTRQDQGIPGVYGLLLLDVVSLGYNDETLFAPFRLTSEQLADPNYRIPTPIANELVKLFAPNG